MKTQKNEVAIVTMDELSLVPDNAMLLNKNQMQLLTMKTPQKYVKKRPAKGGGEWEFVTGSYMKKVLNLMFGFNWSFEIVEHNFDLDIKQAYVLGKLTCVTGGQTITKMQFGRADIKFKVNWVPNPDKAGQTMKQETKIPLDIGNDLKASATDSLKKCASELGICADIYGKDEFREMKITDKKTPQQMEEEIRLILQTEIPLQEEDRLNIERILDEQEVESFENVLKKLDQLIRIVKK